MSADNWKDARTATEESRIHEREMFHQEFASLPAPERPETWANVEREAQTDPLLQNMVSRTRGPLGCFREQALIAMVLYLARERRRWVEEEVARIQNSSEPHAPRRG